MNYLLALFDRMDSFKRVAILLLTGMTALILFLGYRLIDSNVIMTIWDNPPRILQVSNPCYLQQIRDDVFATSIDFPLPSYVKKPIEERVFANITSYLTKTKPDPAELKDLCKSLQLMILDPEAELWLNHFNPKSDKTP